MFYSLDFILILLIILKYREKKKGVPINFHGIVVVGVSCLLLVLPLKLGIIYWHYKYGTSALEATNSKGEKYTYLTDSESSVYGTLLWSATLFAPIWYPVLYGLSHYRAKYHPEFMANYHLNKSKDECDKIGNEYRLNNDCYHYLINLTVEKKFEEAAPLIIQAISYIKENVKNPDIYCSEIFWYNDFLSYGSVDDNLIRKNTFDLCSNMGCYCFHVNWGAIEGMDTSQAYEIINNGLIKRSAYLSDDKKHEIADLYFYYGLMFLREDDIFSPSYAKKLLSKSCDSIQDELKRIVSCKYVRMLTGDETKEEIDKLREDHFMDQVAE